ncbi:MAG TPA: hypothetical protein VF163_15945, partial [Micromonosporaceae bacterium]
MSFLTIAVALGALAVAGWFALYGLMLLITRPRAVAAPPATPDLSPEPPAIASLVGSGWDLTEDAAEATLLDLAARGAFEFRQPSDDPAHTTIHITGNRPTDLLPYEQRIYARVAELAVGGGVPLTALTFRDRRKAAAWWKRFRAEV